VVEEARLLAKAEGFGVHVCGDVFSRGARLGGWCRSGFCGVGRGGGRLLAWSSRARRLVEDVVLLVLLCMVAVISAGFSGWFAGVVL
jgi:hypothetical protein